MECPNSVPSLHTRLSPPARPSSVTPLSLLESHSSDERPRHPSLLNSPSLRQPASCRCPARQNLCAAATNTHGADPATSSFPSLPTPLSIHLQTVGDARH